MQKRDNPGAKIGAVNRERVRAFLRDHLGAQKQDVAAALSISVPCAGRHVRAIRSEWADEK